MGLFKSSCIVLTLSVFRPNWNRDIENTSFVVLIMGITKPCTHLHPAPSTSNQFFLAHFSHHPAPCNTLNIIRTKLSHVTGQFGQFFQVSAEKFKVTYFDWKLAHMISWRCWFRIQTLIFESMTRKSILGGIWAEKVRVVCFPRKLAQIVSRGWRFLFQH